MLIFDFRFLGILNLMRKAASGGFVLQPEADEYTH
jgi:hypothetical protein